MRIFLIFLFLLFVSALFIISNENLHLKNKIEAKKFANLYYSWLINTGANLFKTTAYVVNFEWMDYKNQSNNSTSNK